MKRSFKALLTAVLFAVPMLASCNEAQGPIGPTSNIARQEALVGDLIETSVDLVEGTIGQIGRILSGSDAKGDAVSAWIGSSGGTIRTAAYTLTVPAGAVSKNTKFTVAPTKSGLYTVDLHAYEQGLLGLVDVGANGFDKPVSLTISFANANGPVDASKIVVVYIASPSKVQVQPSFVDLTKKTVSSPLSHFSKYAMVQD